MRGWLFHFMPFSFAPDNRLDGMLPITEWGENNRILFAQAQCIYFFSVILEIFLAGKFWVAIYTPTHLKGKSRKL